MEARDEKRCGGRFSGEIESRRAAQDFQARPRELEEPGSKQKNKKTFFYKVVAVAVQCGWGRSEYHGVIPGSRSEEGAGAAPGPAAVRVPGGDAVPAETQSLTQREATKPLPTRSG